MARVFKQQTVSASQLAASICWLHAMAVHARFIQTNFSYIQISISKQTTPLYFYGQDLAVDVLHWHKQRIIAGRDISL